MEQTFLEIQKGTMEALGFWTEIYRTTLIKQTELMYKTEVIREWTITDILLNGDKVLLKWNKRTFALSEEELKKQYGR